MSLPPLPKKVDIGSIWPSKGYTEDQMRTYAAAVREAALEEAAKVCEQAADKISPWGGAARDCAAAIRALKEKK